MEPCTSCLIITIMVRYTVKVIWKKNPSQEQWSAFHTFRPSMDQWMERWALFHSSLEMHQFTLVQSSLTERDLKWCLFTLEMRMERCTFFPSFLTKEQFISCPWLRMVSDGDVIAHSKQNELQEQCISFLTFCHSRKIVCSPFSDRWWLSNLASSSSVCVNHTCPAGSWCEETPVS